MKKYACEIFTFISCIATKSKLFVYIRSSRIKRANSLLKTAQRRLKRVVKTNNEYCNLITRLNNEIKNKNKMISERAEIIAKQLRL